MHSRITNLVVSIRLWYCRHENHAGRDLQFVQKLDNDKELRLCRNCGTLVVAKKSRLGVFKVLTPPELSFRPKQ